MKLNNRGWSLKTELILIGLLVACLIVAIFFIYRSTLVFDNASSETETKQNEVNNQEVEKEEEKEQEEVKEEKSYEQYETTMENEAVEYYKMLYPEESSYEVKLIKMDELIDNGYLDKIYDISDNTECDGYVLIDIDSQNKIIPSAYLSCSNYKSE